MRIRRLMTFATGAAVGAGTVYLFDPEHGRQRRRQARRAAVAQARQQAARTVVDARRRARTAAAAAAAGYRQARAPQEEHAPGGQPH